MLRSLLFIVIITLNLINISAHGGIASHIVHKSKAVSQQTLEEKLLEKGGLSELSNVALANLLHVRKQIKSCIECDHELLDSIEIDLNNRGEAVINIGSVEAAIHIKRPISINFGNHFFPETFKKISINFNKIKPSKKFKCKKDQSASLIIINDIKNRNLAIKNLSIRKFSSDTVSNLIEFSGDCDMSKVDIINGKLKANYLSGYSSSIIMLRSLGSFQIQMKKTNITENLTDFVVCNSFSSDTRLIIKGTKIRASRKKSILFEGFRPDNIIFDRGSEEDPCCDDETAKEESCFSL